MPANIGFRPEKMDSGGFWWNSTGISSEGVGQGKVITWRMNKIARSLEVQWIVVGMKIPCLVRQSTITRIASQSEEVGRGSMKSIEIEFQGSSGIGSCFNIP